MQYGRGAHVPEMSRQAIRQRTESVWNFARDHLDKRAWGKETGFPILHLCEIGIPGYWPDVTFLVGDEDEMGDDHGRARPDLYSMKIREDVCLGARQGNGRDRFTIAHELGHLLLHRGVDVYSFKRNAPPTRNRCSEWQADCFAGELLVPHWLAREYKNASEVAANLGVSISAAKYQLARYREEDLL